MNKKLLNNWAIEILPKSIIVKLSESEAQQIVNDTPSVVTSNQNLSEQDQLDFCAKIGD